jgi:uncharacterized MnhB-related membrane protein
MIYILVAAGIIVCAIQALRTPKILASALWLAATSALTALLVYMLSAPEIAVIELSVGAGLVTILFVFAINIVGEESLALRSIIPTPWIWGSLIVIIILGISWFFIDMPNTLAIAQETDITTTLWHDRSLDILLQIVMIFGGIIGVIGLLSEDKAKSTKEEEA